MTDVPSLSLDSKDEPFDTTPHMQLFLYYILEKRRVQARRDSGMPQPWTKDPFLLVKGFSIENVREEQPIQRSLLDVFKGKDHRHPAWLWNVWMHRYLSNPKSSQQLGFVEDLDKAINTFEAWMHNNERFRTSIFMSCDPDHRILEAIRTNYKLSLTLSPKLFSLQNPPPTRRNLFNIFKKEFKLCGSFHANQMSHDIIMYGAIPPEPAGSPEEAFSVSHSGCSILEYECSQKGLFDITNEVNRLLESRIVYDDGKRREKATRLRPVDIEDLLWKFKRYHKLVKPEEWVNRKTKGTGKGKRKDRGKGKGKGKGQVKEKEKAKGKDKKRLAYERDESDGDNYVDLSEDDYDDEGSYIEDDSEEESEKRYGFKRTKAARDYSSITLRESSMKAISTFTPTTGRRYADTRSNDSNSVVSDDWVLELEDEASESLVLSPLSDANDMTLRLDSLQDKKSHTSEEATAGLPFNVDSGDHIASSSTKQAKMILDEIIPENPCRIREEELNLTVPVIKEEKPISPVAHVKEGQKVKAVLDLRCNNGLMEYLVEWVDSERNRMSWEPFESLQDCEAMDRFLRIEPSVLIREQRVGVKPPIKRGGGSKKLSIKRYESVRMSEKELAVTTASEEQPISASAVVKKGHLVNAVLDLRCNNSLMEYLVEWVDSERNTMSWEPFKSLQDCEAMDRFLRIEPSVLIREQRVGVKPPIKRGGGSKKLSIKRYESVRLSEKELVVTTASEKQPISASAVVKKGHLVNAVLDLRCNNGLMEYQVEWVDSERNTMSWVPFESLQGCEAMDRFLRIEPSVSVRESRVGIRAPLKRGGLKKPSIKIYESASMSEEEPPISPARAKRFLQSQESPPSPITEVGEIEYRVRAILERKKIGTQFYYLVDWDGYGEEDRTWEPLRNVCDCEAYLTFCVENGLPSRRGRPPKKIKLDI
ncbi:hypothetical protein HDU67_006723 [Dinochytrium kinnereticum]|nr:hypothetical protein HDU67_006723 [Dinochytrium kinnereticum]